MKKKRRQAVPGDARMGSNRNIVRRSYNGAGDDDHDGLEIAGRQTKKAAPTADGAAHAGPIDQPSKQNTHTLPHRRGIGK